MLPEVEALIKHYRFERLPVESTLFTSTYQSAERTARNGPIGSAIIGLYCEEPISISHFHKLTTDEVWHFYAGDPLRLILLFPDGSSSDIILGNRPLAGQYIQYVIPAGVWQAGHLVAGGRYALFGCTMAPGFTNSMFIGGTRSRLLARYPERATDIERYGCADDQIHMRD